MCDDGEKTCPLCAEEMDLTDQQLKPCKCGYEICVWCWHHIMEMAEKDETEGRCPACRTPYDKEKIVGMASRCERVVAEVNMEKKMKSQKTKAKSLEGRKQFSSVRVIQRNLVYIVGLPLNLAEEDVLQCKEYFGQYGKVLKVSMSRTAAGVIQQFPNNTCSVYITYSKEEEAIRCIQSVHGFTLDGRSLRACFGTTKYCHAWLRNMPCNNPDCLYLHEVGSQEDSFTKDEIISAYTRVEQITANVNTTQRRSGNVLPPPLDNYSNGTAASPGKPIIKSVLNSAATVKGSPPNGSTGRSIGLPAAASWGTRALSCSSHSAGSECSNGSTKVKSDPSIGDTTVEATLLPTCSTLKSPLLNGESHISLAKKRVNSPNASSWHPALDSEFSKPDKQEGSMASINKFSGQVCDPPNNSRTTGINMTPNDGLELSSSPAEAEVGSDVTSLSITESTQHESSGACKSVSDPHFIGSPENQDLHQKLHEEHYTNGLTSSNVRKTSSDESPSINMKATVDTLVEEDVISFDNQRLLDPEVMNHKVYSSTMIAPPPEKLISSLLQPHSTHIAIGSSGFLHASSGSGVPNGCAGHSLPDPAGLRTNVEQPLRGMHNGTLQGDATSSKKNGILDAGESSIISNILSWDFDPWNHSLTSPHNLAKLLGATDKHQGSISSTDSWKVQSNSQSRFSFARQEESVNDPLRADPAYGGYGQLLRNRSTIDDRELYLHMHGFDNGFPSRSSAETINFSDSQYVTNNNSVTRSQISAPPGFSVPSKTPPPGFSCPERMDQTSDSLSGNRVPDMPTIFGNTETQMNGSGMGNSVDIEFIDPAILAVGKGRLQAGGHGSAVFDIGSSPHQLRAFGGDSRLDLLTQRSISPHQSLQYETRDAYSSIGDSFRVPSRILDQPSMGSLNYTQMPSFHQVRNSAMENGYWNGWNEMQGGGNGMMMTELLGNERFGMNKLFNGYEEWKFKMPSSVDLHSRTFGM